MKREREYCEALYSLNEEYASSEASISVIHAMSGYRGKHKNENKTREMQDQRPLYMVLMNYISSTLQNEVRSSFPS